MGSQLSSVQSKSGLQRLLVYGVPLPAAHRARLEPFFSSIQHRPNRREISEGDVRDVDIIYGDLPALVNKMAQVPCLQLVQLASAGSDEVLKSSLWSDEQAGRIQLATAAGVHTGAQGNLSARFCISQSRHMTGPIPQVQRGYYIALQSQLTSINPVLYCHHPNALP